MQRRSRTRRARSAGAPGAAAPRRVRSAQCPPRAARRCRSGSSTAPPISIRWVGPQRVTSWPKSRCHMSSSGKPTSEKAPQAQISTPPSGACQSRVMPHRGRARPLARQHDREEARGEDAEQAGEDEVVRGVGQRAGVAAVVDVQRDVPVHAEHRGDQRDGGERGGQRGPARRSRRRCGEGGRAAGAACRRPARWPEPSHSRATVSAHRGAGGDEDLPGGGARGRRAGAAARRC